MKRMIMFLDGSGVSAADGERRKISNLFRLNLAIANKDSTGVPQIVFYLPGVGTRGDNLSQATGEGLDEIIREAYVNLASNYEPKDEVYIFGYSRGGVAARALAGLISDAGLLKAHHLNHLAVAYQRFLMHPIDKAEERLSKERLISDARWPKTKSPVVKFLGTFDPVPGNEWDEGELFTKIRFRSLKMDPCVKVGVQILALDDDRFPSFAPLLWDGPGEGHELSPRLSKRKNKQQVIEQIWMPGVHGDIGGDSEGKILADIALLTMIDRIQFHCEDLTLDKDSVNYIRNRMKYHNEFGVSNERFNFIRKILERNKRLIGKTKCEHLHPICELISNLDIDFKGQESVWKAPSEPTLSGITTRYDNDFKKACLRAIAGTANTNPIYPDLGGWISYIFGSGARQVGLGF